MVSFQFHRLVPFAAAIAFAAVLQVAAPSGAQAGDSGDAPDFFNAYYEYAIYLEGHAFACAGGAPDVQDAGLAIDEKVRVLLVAQALLPQDADQRDSAFAGEAISSKAFITFCMMFKCDGVPKLDCDRLLKKFKALPILDPNWTVEAGMHSLYPERERQVLQSIQAAFDMAAVSKTEASATARELAANWVNE